MREEYESASQKRDYHFEEEVLEFLGSFLRDNERKIEGNKKRLELTDETPEMETKVGVAVGHLGIVCIQWNPSNVGTLGTW